MKSRALSNLTKPYSLFFVHGIIVNKLDLLLSFFVHYKKRKKVITLSNKLK